VGFWASTQDICDNWGEDKRWMPGMAEEVRDRLFGKWNKAVERSRGWVG
jgi:glycerol kinase